jgi:hypothetical protein
VAASYGVIFREQFLEMVRKQGLEPLKLAQEGVQLFETGWVAMRDPLEDNADAQGLRQPGFRPVALLHRDETITLIAFLQAVIKRWSDRGLERVWLDALGRIGREDVRHDPDASPADIFRKWLGVTVDLDMLHLRFENVAAKDLARMRAYLQYKLDLLQDVLQGYRSTYQHQWKEDGERMVRVSREKREWWFGVDHNLRAWVPREYLP